MFSMSARMAEGRLTQKPLYLEDAGCSSPLFLDMETNRDRHLPDDSADGACQSAFSTPRRLGEKTEAGVTCPQKLIRANLTVRPCLWQPLESQEFRRFFPKLAERNIRKGFVEDQEYERPSAPAIQIWPAGALFEVGYSFGWRIWELLNLRVDQVDLLNRTILLLIRAKPKTMTGG